MKLRMNEVNANFWKRVLAYIIDAVIVNVIIIWPFQKTLTELTSAYQDQNLLKYMTAINEEALRNALPQLGLLFVIISLLTIAYWALLEHKFGQSIGKMIMKIYVKSDEKILTLWQCVVRNISKISGILLIIDCIGIISNNQRYLERVSKTKVIEKRFTI
ncbi:MAG: RDD family protein [Candidatus Nanoarchaeia archaeon]